MSDDFSIIKQAVMEGVGIAVLPAYMCSKEISTGKLINILPQWSMSEIDIYALYPKHRARIPKVKALLEFLDEAFVEKLSG